MEEVRLQECNRFRLRWVEGLEQARFSHSLCPLCLLSPAILGMYTLMSNKQYYDAICSGEICNTEGISSECVWEHGAQGSGQVSRSLSKGSEG